MLKMIEVLLLIYFTVLDDSLTLLCIVNWWEAGRYNYIPLQLKSLHIKKADKMAKLIFFPLNPWNFCYNSSKLTVSVGIRWGLRVARWRRMQESLSEMNSQVQPKYRGQYVYGYFLLFILKVQCFSSKTYIQRDKK